MSNTAALILETFIVLWSAYLLVSLGGLFSERAGIVNIGLNGLMVIGAMTYAMFLSSESITGALGYWTPFVAILASGIVSCLFALLFGVVTISFYADQVIAGTAINIITTSFSILFIRLIFQQDFLTWSLQNPIDGMTINLTYIMFLVIAIIIIAVSAFVIAKTKFGLRLKSSGENPYALETSGVSVARIRYIAVAISGILAGMAGAMAMPAFSNTFNGTVNGMGYIALAILIFGQWKIVGITIGSIIMSFLMAIGNYWQVFNINFPSEFIKMLPFIIPLIILIFVKSTNSPKMVGKPFKKDERT